MDPRALNPKKKLVEFAQRYTGRPVEKGDIVYVVRAYGGEHQATVSLNFIDGQAFAGELSPAPKEAEHAAAAQALDGLKDEVEAVGLGKRKFEPASADDGYGGQEWKRPRQWSDGGAQWPEGGSQWPEGGAQWPEGGAQWPEGGAAAKGSSKGKDGKGWKGWKGWYPSWEDMMWMMWMMKGKAHSKGGKNFGKEFGKDFGKDFGKEFGKDFGKEFGKEFGGKGAGCHKGPKGSWKSGPDLPRTRLSEEAISGEVIEWKGQYGWIKPTEDAESSSLDSSVSKVYVHIKDVVDVDSLVVGQSVHFKAYKDASGVGAEEVEVT